MARQAQQIHIADLQHVRIRGSVGCMARLAPFNFDCLMFEYERPALLSVALEAHSVLCRRGPQLFVRDSSVRVMTIAARYQALVHAVVEGHCKLRLLL